MAVFCLLLSEVGRWPVVECGSWQCNGKHKYPPARGLGTSHHVAAHIFSHYFALQRAFRCRIAAFPIQQGHLRSAAAAPSSVKGGAQHPAAGLLPKSAPRADTHPCCPATAATTVKSRGSGKNWGELCECKLYLCFLAGEGRRGISS